MESMALGMLVLDYVDLPFGLYCGRIVCRGVLNPRRLDISFLLVLAKPLDVQWVS